ncbi:MAG: ABC transporter permease [Alphaproteobacteria bacterium]|jgi:peptide/nickel transport system permease protein|nr:ABC transporter permease [Alphaproteobacteria bacterium]MBT4016692.1 ABC transporter permease [Alphaproteobacteria bacterium]MBT4966606.1 ABC transporter permease [Alphaproteobacteria bacterium]MBT5159883.1 ABC transporter permease [Alphaproteobacteria bacterium]MBT5917148.1 ABC transporter permease [Alphaproteobacteria bacterium]
MLIFAGKRIAALVLTMVVVSILLFLALEFTPGDVATKVLGPYSSPEQRQLWLEAHGYNAPLVQRYFSWAANFATGDWGQSLRFKVPVSEILWPRLGNTAILGLATFAVMIPLSMVLGILSGMKEGSKLDRSISVTSIITTSIPEFASAVFVVAIFVFWLKLLPGTSTMTNGFDPLQLIMPVLVLVIYDFGYVTRMTRASMAEVMTTQYIRTAILKGVPWSTVVLKHALRNALIAPFTVIMLQVNWLLSGVIVVEFFFAYKGFGALILEAALNKDIFLLEACTMITVFVAVASQMIADLGYTYLNPRIRFA